MIIPGRSRADLFLLRGPVSKETGACCEQQAGPNPHDATYKGRDRLLDRRHAYLRRGTSLRQRHHDFFVKPDVVIGTSDLPMMSHGAD